MKQILLLTFCLALGVAALADEARPQPRRGAGDGKGASERMMDRFREQDPEAYKELQQLRESDPEAFRARVRELFAARAQHGGKAKPGGKGFRPDGSGSKFGGGGRPDMRRGPGGGKEFMQRLFERVAQHDPEKAASLRKLLEEDPEAFRIEVRKMLSANRPVMDAHHGKPDGERRGSRSPGREAIEVLRDAYQDADSAEKRAEVRKQVRVKLEELFDAEMVRQDERVEMMAKQIEAMRQRLAARRAQRDALVDQQESELLDVAEPKLD